VVAVAAHRVGAVAVAEHGLGADVALFTLVDDRVATDGVWVAVPVPVAITISITITITIPVAIAIARVTITSPVSSPSPSPSPVVDVSTDVVSAGHPASVRATRATLTRQFIPRLYNSQGLSSRPLTRSYT
jgi:hypothetical protein